MFKATAVNATCYIFVWGTTAVVFFLKELDLLAPCCWSNAKRSHIWLPVLSMPDVGKWQAFLPDWFVEGASMAPVFSVDSCWDTFPHLCIAVLCVSAYLIWRGKDLMKNCVIFPFKEMCSGWGCMYGGLDFPLSVLALLCFFYFLTTYGIWFSSHTKNMSVSITIVSFSYRASSCHAF